MLRHFLEIIDWTPQEILDCIDLGIELKNHAKTKKYAQELANHSYGLIFRKNSLRTRISFEVGITKMGGQAIHLTDQDFQLGERESIQDVAKVMSRYLDAILIRTFAHQQVEEFAKYSDVPIINMLTDWCHPCQIIADAITIEEKLGTIRNKKVVYLGDGNNVARSWINFASRIPMHLCIATAPESTPEKELLEKSRSTEVSTIEVSHDPFEAVKNADVLYTDVWASMGEKELATEKEKILHPFQVNAKLLKHTKSNVVVMHCLPAERGREITQEVMDGDNSVVFDQAENRLYAHQAILLQLERWKLL